MDSETRKRTGIRLILFILLLVAATWCWGMKDAWCGDEVEADESVIVPAEEKTEDFQRWAFFPVIGSQTETGLQLGGIAVRFFEPEAPEYRTSTIDFVAFGTTNGQFFAAATPDFYFDRDRYHVSTSFSARYWPSNYYGIGPDTSEDDEIAFESKGIKAKLLLERRLFTSLYGGVLYQFANSWVEPDIPGTLEPGMVAGAEGGLRSGFGGGVTLDTRDNLNDARSGTFIRAEAVAFRDTFGSDFDYNRYQFDVRQFFPLPMTMGLAVRAYTQLMRGDIPFQELSSPGGYNMLRGIENGRYRDQDLVSLQVEWRYPIYNRFRGTLFVETAQVAHDLGELNNDGWLGAAGAGLRYSLNTSERFNVRLDVSYVDGGAGVTLGMREAF